MPVNRFSRQDLVFSPCWPKHGEECKVYGKILKREPNMKNFICIHGHFYQPPRENPWLETIEVQRSAAPFHDWNERIAAECYAPNRAARLLDAKGKITSLIDNYRHISFNFGPTLLLWLEREDPATYAAILAADAASFQLHKGHGAAIAQAWGHIILPLANRRDKMTQIRWGIADFTARFARPPEGMWLPEAAVDIESLELMVAAGIRFTILSPFQARRVRGLTETPWQPVDNGAIDSRHPYLCRLPSGQSIAVFFYDGSLARAVAFGGLLSSGDAFAAALKAGFHPEKGAQLVHLATDGESYGHHHKFGEMALARAIDHIHTDKSAQLTVYGAFLATHPPQVEVEIVPMSSWSCAHGVERWRSDCGCHIGTNASWNQKWRSPLRDAFDHLRDRLIPLFEKFAGEIFSDPWATRDAYIEVILDRSTTHVKNFLTKAAKHELTPRQEQQGLELLEMQHHTMQMYTSCGWFFDEVSGIETVQLLTYAARAIDLARAACGVDLEESFREMLRLVPSNLPRWRNTEVIYAEVVTPQRIDLRQVAANYAISVLLGGSPAEEFYCYTLHCEQRRQSNGHRLQMVSGRIQLRSKITWEEKDFAFAALHFGDLDVLAGVRGYALPTEPNEDAVLQQLLKHGDRQETAVGLKRLFGAHLYTLTDLFMDERQRTVNQMISAQVAKILEEFSHIYRDHLGLLHFLHENALPVPAPLSAAAEQLLTEEILLYLGSDEAFSGRVREKIKSAKTFDLKLDQALLTHAASRRSRSLLLALAAAPDDQQRLTQAIKDFDELLTLPWPIDLWQAQNIYFDIRQQVLPTKVAAVEKKVVAAEKWLQQFEKLGSIIGIRL
jgi:alpha-amylase/alpha-mannosidase (GH57 family)